MWQIHVSCTRVNNNSSRLFFRLMRMWYSSILGVVGIWHLVFVTPHESLHFFYQTLYFWYWNHIRSLCKCLSSAAITWNTILSHRANISSDDSLKGSDCHSISKETWKLFVWIFTKSIILCYSNVFKQIYNR